MKFNQASIATLNKPTASVHIGLISNHPRRRIGFPDEEMFARSSLTVDPFDSSTQRSLRRLFYHLSIQVIMTSTTATRRCCRRCSPLCTGIEVELSLFADDARPIVQRFRSDMGI